MEITARDRKNLYDGLEDVLGDSLTNILMHLLPLQPAAELVTRADLFATGAELRGEMAELRGEMAELRGEMAELGAELRGEMAELGADLRSEMAELGADLRGEMVDLKTELRGEMAELRVELKGDVLRVENNLTHRFAEFHSSMNRWAVGLVAANVIGMVTAIVT